MLYLIKMLKQDDSGATAIEYGLIAGAMAVLLIAGIAAFGDQLSGLFEGIGTTLGDNTPG